jgi:hypothetical protein
VLGFLLFLVEVSAMFDANANKMRVNSVEYLTDSYPYMPIGQRKVRMIATKLVQG